MKLNTTTGQKPARGFELEANAWVEMETKRGIFSFLFLRGNGGKGIRGSGVWPQRSNSN